MRVKSTGSHKVTRQKINIHKESKQSNTNKKIKLIFLPKPVTYSHKYTEHIKISAVFSMERADVTWCSLFVHNRLGAQPLN